MNSEYTCKICSHSNGHSVYRVKELQYGMGEEFVYFQCPKCKCLQIATIPQNISKYYPGDYYSYKPVSAPKLLGSLKRKLERRRNKFGFYGTDFIGKALYTWLPELLLPKLSRLNPSKEARILDVGCGSGRPLNFLAEEGFKNIVGIDPLIEGDNRFPNGLQILKRHLQEMSGHWDIIMFNHSFEHMPEPVETLQKAYGLLADDGCCLVSIPTVSSFAWRNFGVHWSGLDAPRHFFLHSIESFKIVAEKAGFEVRETLFDSNAAQFWGSENFRLGIPLKANRNWSMKLSNSFYRTLNFYRHYKQAEKLNREKQGDLVAFYLHKK